LSQGEAFGETIVDQVLIQDDIHIRFQEMRAGSFDTEKDLSTITDLFFRPYWTRLWIGQEVLLARNVLMFCGRFQRQLPSKTLQAQLLVTYLGIFMDQVGEDVAAGYLFSHLTNKRRVLSLMDILNSYTRGKCTDTRDKVFGLQAFARPGERIPVDYNLIVEEVFVEAAEAMRPTSISPPSMADWGNCVMNLRIAMGLSVWLVGSRRTKRMESWLNDSSYLATCINAFGADLDPSSLRWKLRWSSPADLLLKVI
jgi:hypothetical protein